MVSLRRTANRVETWWRVWWNGMYCCQMSGVGVGVSNLAKAKAKCGLFRFRLCNLSGFSDCLRRQPLFRVQKQTDTRPCGHKTGACTNSQSVALPGSHLGR
jgi:hypothetical protein